MLHLAFRAYDDVETASVGEGIARSLVAFPKGYDQATYQPPPPAIPPRPSFNRGPRR